VVTTFSVEEEQMQRTPAGWVDRVAARVRRWGRVLGEDAGKIADDFGDSMKDAAEAQFRRLQRWGEKLRGHSH
jgi:hypothetical protein